jgi:hypothetical protein
VLASWIRDQDTEYLLSPITTTKPREASGIELEPAHFGRGALPRQSFVRPYLFAKTESTIAYTWCTLTESAVRLIKRAIMDILER